MPSNLALDRFGARLWIARIMFSWGLVSGMFAFIGPISAATGLSNEWVFYILRFILGAAEAGFFPGIIFYLTLWFPSVYRARVVALFMLAIPFSSIVGAPVSGALLNLSGAGLRRLAVAVHHRGDALDPDGLRRRLLPDRPAGAGDAGSARTERAWLRAAGGGEQAEAGGRAFGIGKALSDPRVLACAFVYFCLNAASYGVAFFLPTIVKGFGVSNFQTGLLAALPFVFGAVGMVLLGRRLRPHAEAAGACLLRHDPGRGRRRGRGAGLRPGPGAGPALPRPDRRLRDAAAALADPDRLPDRAPRPRPGSPRSTRSATCPGFAGPYMMGYLETRPATSPPGCWCWAAAPWSAGLWR